MLLVHGTFVSSGVLFTALTAAYGWSRATTSLPFSVALVGYAATAWLAGRLFDRYGPRRMFPLGALCFGLGLITSAQDSLRNMAVLESAYLSARTGFPEQPAKFLQLIRSADTGN